MPKVLVTGGAGYIGSHTCVELLNAGYEVVVMDNLCNSKAGVLDRIETITGKKPAFIEGDVRDYDAVKRALCGVDGVIHFAGLKAVGESVKKPLLYYDNNLGSTITLLQAMEEMGVNAIVFSSSATVYGDPATVPVKEDFPLSCASPYAYTKYMCERILEGACVANENLSALLLRYFNPIGAHESGIIGEDPNGIPNNLLPYIAKVAVGQLPKLTIFGDDYPTRDGTGVRDYIHVVDLAKGHVLAMDYALTHKGAEAINLGTGSGSSVLEVFHAFERACGRELPYMIGPRREGDVPEYFAETTKAKELLGWVAEKDIDDMCADTWRWQKGNPNGYEE
ncbi:MAG: UDP-glucose 4-epimerase GalE [Clostridiales bacterium]|nr:UDP-glucose 4-epimerase GalE [Clostridiales bacterium]